MKVTLFRTRSFLSLIALLFLAASVSAADTLDFTSRLASIGPDNKFAEPGYYIWCGSGVRGEDGKYYLFYSRWKAGSEGRLAGDEVLFKDMSGWLKYSEIAVAVSDSPAGPFHHVTTVLKGSGDTNRWDCFNAHNPQIKVFGGKAYLYYIANNPVTNSDRWMQHADGQRIGVAVSDSVTNLIAGHFHRCAQPLVSPDGTNTFCRTVNPSVTQGRNGLYLMIFKSRSAPSGGRMTMWIASSAQPDGPFHLEGPAITNVLWEAEDPCFWYDRDRDRYYAIVKDYSRQHRDLSPQFGALALLTSARGTGDWQVAAHNLVSLREFTDAAGQKHQLTNLERPQLLFDGDGKPICLYAAAGEEDPFTGHPSFNLHFAIRDAAPLATHAGKQTN
jgi:hypothetical protein